MSKQKSILLIVILAIAVNFANIGGLDIYALDEAKNAEAAREMFESGDYVVPYYNYQLRTDKPPLHYYFMSAGYAIFGVNAFGARFFSSIMAVLTILITYLFASKHFSPKTGLNAALVLLASLHFAMQFHMSVPDPYLIFFMTWAFYSFYEAYQSNSKWHLLAFYFAIGCGLLTKGPIALGLTGLTALIFLIVQKDFKLKTIVRLQPIGGVILALLIAIPWFYAVHIQTDGVWTEEFFFKHNFSRFSDSMEGHSGSPLVTLAFVFGLGMLAFLPFSLQSLKHVWENRKESALIYIGIAAMVIVVFFAISSTKLPNYTVPAYPLLAILIGHYISQLNEKWFSKLGNRIGLIFYATLLITFPIGIYFGLAGDKSLAHLNSLGFYFIPLAGLGIYILIQTFKRKSIERILWMNICTWIVTVVLFFHLIFPQVDAENPVRKTLPTMDTDQTLIAFKRLNPAFVFALQREIPMMDDLEEIKIRMASSPSGYIISRTEFQEELATIPGLVFHAKARDTFENPITLVMKWGIFQQ
jgi:4-amino-4-deoxy-L-arabinose transferase-like glycosyltransferase